MKVCEIDRDYRERKFSAAVDIAELDLLDRGAVKAWCDRFDALQREYALHRESCELCKQSYRLGERIKDNGVKVECEVVYG